jgi:hypothetical protein
MGVDRGISMQDRRWQHGTEQTCAVTCCRCKELMQA